MLNVTLHSVVYYVLLLQVGLILDTRTAVPVPGI